MLEALRHRGPDDEGVAVYPIRDNGDRLVLGHRRLSIIDLEGGHQPLYSEDGDVAVVCNGEIYDYQRTRKDLETRGHIFKTGSDNEVIVHLYEEYGFSFVDHLRGMFALALWDEKKKTLVLARDRLGVKPLYWARTPSEGDGVVFASELPALLAFPGMRRHLDPKAVDAYLAFLYVPDPMTGFADVHKLPPAHMLIWSEGDGARVRRYWNVPNSEPDPDAVHAFGEVFDEAVGLRLMADVPVGSFFSGGLDSTSIVASARTHGLDLDTFTVGFSDPEATLYDESDWARLAADAIDVPHHRLEGSLDVSELLPAVTRHLGEPFGNPTAFLAYELSRATSDHATVALAGDGADELLGGYPRFVGYLNQKRMEAIPASFRRVAGSVLAAVPESTKGRHWLRRAAEFGSTLDQTAENAYMRWVTYFNPSMRSHLYSDRFREKVSGHDAEAYLARLFERAPQDPINRLSYVELQSFLPGNVLHYGDRMSMAHGLEVRVPFTDHELVEGVLAIPGESKVNGRVTKSLLRESMRERVPESVLRRPKRGFNPPMGLWLRNRLRATLRNHLSAGSLRERGIFEPFAVDGLISGFETGNRDLSPHLWALVALEAWLREYEVMV